MYKGLAGCLRVVVKKEGVGALYKGLGTSVIGIVPYAGIDLAVNSVLKDAASKVYSARGEEPGVTSVLACGMISSTIAMLATYPINLVRTRLQASGMPGSPKYASPMDVVRQAVRAGGPAALFQGLLPNLMKVLPATSISYAVYDQLSKEAPSGKKKGPSPG
jgi:solute carrier family 25 phosphate transporter 23/24/25/41